MRKWISASLAGTILMGSLILLAVFHILVLLGAIPPDLLWGGMAGGPAGDIRTLEIIALLLTVTFLVIVWAKLGEIRTGKFRRITTVGVWILFLYLVLNTLGNLASGVAAENLVFAPVTLVLAVLALRLALER